MSNIPILFAVLAVLAPAAAAAVQTAAATPPAGVAAPYAPAGDAKPERPVCRRIATTGSRVGAKRVCHTAAEWRELDGGGGAPAMGGNVMITGQH